MDKHIQKLKKLVDSNLNKSKSEILKDFGKPQRRSDNGIWFFKKFSLSLFYDEIAFIFEEDHVVDIILTQYFLGLELKTTYYHEGNETEYKVVKNF